jgi:hypothetical protein
MSPKVRPASPPSPEAREHLLDIIRSTDEPLPARSLARLLVPPHRITTANLGPILEEYVAAGCLYRLPPASARGAPRYWDRDATALLRAAALQVVRQSDRPNTARELLALLGVSFKVKEPELTEALNEHVVSSAVHTIPAATAKGKPRYWHRNATEFARLEFLKVLEAKGPQSQAKLRKAVNGFSESQFQQIVNGALEARILWRHPPLGKSKLELIGKAPPSPDRYLRDVGTQLAKIIAQLQAANVPREELRRSVVQLVEAAGIEFTAGRDFNRDGKALRAAPTVDLIGLMRCLEPGADRGALVGARELRRAAQLDKQSFDDAVVELARQGRLSLHRHDYAASLSQTERDELVADGAGTYYVGMALRFGGGPFESAAN